MNKQSEKILIFGHRGASNIAPENTMKAFKKAIELGANYVEFDVHLSKDEEIIIMHDGNTLRTTGRAGLIKNMTLKELKQLDAGDGEQIPTLDELITLARGKIGLQLEIKAPKMTNKIVDAIRNTGLIDSTIISAFNYSELLKIQEIEPEIKLAALVIGMRKNKVIKTAIKNNFFAIHPFYKLINSNFIKIAHKYDIRVNAWTVNSVSAMRKLIEIEIDGLVTDHVELAKNVLSRI